MLSINKFLKYFVKFKALDWFVIVAAVSVVIFLIVTSVNQDKWVNIEFKVTVTPTYFPYSGETPPYWIVDNIKPGDSQYDSFGQQNLRIIDVKSWGIQTKDTWMTASVKAKYKPKQNKYTFQYQPLEIGRSLDVTINGTNIHGIVTSIEGQADSRKTYELILKTRLIDTGSPYSTVTRGVDPWYADAINKGLTMKDTSGRVVAEILEKEVKPAERVITTSDGRVFLGEDPLKKDVFLTVKLKVTKHDNTYTYLENVPIKIGFSFPIYLDNVFIVPNILQIQE